MDPQQNRNLLIVAESILKSLIEKRNAELVSINQEIRDRVLPREGFEWYQTNPEMDSLNSRQNTASQSIRSFRISLQSVQAARNNGNAFNVCSLCGLQVSIPAILEHSLMNKIPLRKLPCNTCDKAKSVRQNLKEHEKGAGT